MTDYAKISLDAVLSENTDYSDPRVKLETTQTLTPTAYISKKITALPTGLTLLDFVPTALTGASVDSIIIQNLDTTNFVTVGWNALPSVTAQIANPGSTGFTFAQSGSTITDNTSGSKFVNAAAGLYLHNGNATNAANKGKNMLITEKVSDHVVKVATALTDASNDTAVSFTLNSYNQQRISAGGILVIPGNILIDAVTLNFNEIQITANTATVSCNVMIFGS